MEEWRSVSGYEGIYEVSNLGRVRSVRHSTLCSNGQVRTFREWYLAPYLKPNGYYAIALRNNGKTHKHYIHRLVATAFCDNPNNEKCVDHIDCDKSNNKASNLEWVSYSDNMLRAFANGICEKSREASRRNVKIMNSKRRERICQN